MTTRRSVPSSRRSSQRSSSTERRVRRAAVGLLVACLLLSGCTDREDGPGSGALANDTFCGLLESAAVRPMLPDDSYDQGGQALTRGFGERAARGNCRLTGSEGRPAFSIVVDQSDSTFADTMRQRDDRVSERVDEGGVQGWAGYTGDTSGAGYALLEQGPIIVTTTVHTPAEGRDGAQDALTLARMALVALGGSATTTGG